MKSLNKKLYSVIIVCLLVLCFSLSVFATEITDPNTSSSSQAAVTTSTQSEEGTGSDESTPSDGDASSDLSSTSSDGTESGDLSSTDSDLSGSSNLSSGEQVVSNESDEKDTSSGKTSSKRPSYHGNVGGYIDDEADTSGWGGSDDESSELVSAGTTEKKENKNITDYSGLLWILIWIPVLLILGSVGALVYVNRKAFFEAEETYSDLDDENPPKRRKLSAAEKAKRKNNHKNRTNVYKPRDQPKHLSQKC